MLADRAHDLPKRLTDLIKECVSADNADAANKVPLFIDTVFLFVATVHLFIVTFVLYLRSIKTPPEAPDIPYQRVRIC